jgi:hypothetical protein
VKHRDSSQIHALENIEEGLQGEKFGSCSCLCILKGKKISR